MMIGAKVREKKDPPGQVMTVEAITPRGWIVCSWRDPVTRKDEARMFFLEMLEEVSSSPMQKNG